MEKENKKFLIGLIIGATLSAIITYGFGLYFEKQSSRPWQDYVIDGDRYSYHSQFHDAYQSYSKALLSNPTDPSILRKTGLSLIGSEYFGNDESYQYSYFISYPARYIISIEDKHYNDPITYKNLIKSQNYCELSLKYAETNYEQLQSLVALGTVRYCLDDDTGAIKCFETAATIVPELMSDRKYSVLNNDGIEYMNQGIWMALKDLYVKHGYSDDKIQECDKVLSIVLNPKSMPQPLPDDIIIAGHL